MASVNLKVTPEQLKTLAGQFETEFNNIQTAFKNIDKTVNGTNKYWQGDASAKHIKKYNEVKPDADKVVKNLLEAPKHLLQIAGLYIQAETDNKAQAQSLPGDIF